MDLLKFGLTILFIVVYLAVHLSKVWREQKEQEARRNPRPSDPSSTDETEVDRRIAEAQRRRREQQQEAAAMAAGTRPRVARKPIPIQVVETPAPKTRITYSQPAPKSPQPSVAQPLPTQKSAPQPSAMQPAPKQGAALVGLGPVATVAKRTASPALVQLSALLSDRKNLAAAFLLKEIFDKPISQRK